VCGLGLPVGAVARAQTAPPVSTAASPARDTAAAKGQDSTAKAPPKADTLMANFARAELPASTDVGPAYRWNRDQIAATGALSLGELLDRIPGLTTIRTGWITDIQHTTVAGAFGRVRVFIDGLELDPLDAESGGVLNIGPLQLWPYEEVVVERVGSEARVHLRTWRERRTNPLTRIDVLTGDREGNVFRGTYAKRWTNGAGLQAVFSNASTRDIRGTSGGDGSVLGLFLRAGWARGDWSVDAVAHRYGNERRGAPRARGLDTTQTDRPQQTISYLRVGYRDPDASGVWGQLLVGSLDFRETPPGSSLNRITSNTTDTTRATLRRASQAQYLLTTGWNHAGLQTSLAARVRAQEGEQSISPIARASYTRGWVSSAVWAEQSRPDSATRVDASVQVLPFQRLTFVGAASRVTRSSGGADLRSSGLRAEAAVRLRGALWLGGGLIRRDTTVAPGPATLDTGYAAPIALRPATGALATLRGDVFRDIKIDAWMIAWRDAQNQFYLPKVQARTQLYVQSDWRTRFPKGQFSFLGAIIHEYRDPLRFSSSSGVQVTEINRNLSTLMEIRILNATLSWRFSNILQLNYDQAPGYVLPRAVNLYGIRWEFRG
jgi:hypothetical protein